MMLKMQAGLRDAKVKEDKATETEKSLQKAIADLKGKLDATNTTVNVQLDTANKVVDMAAAELIEEVEKTQPVEQTKSLLTSTATEEKGETTSAATDAAIPGKKKGKKRKAKNAVSGEEVEVVDAPAQKKVASQPITVEKVEVTSTAADTESAVVNVQVPPPQKKPIQVKKAPQKKVITQTAATKQEDSSDNAVPDAEIVKAANQQKAPTQTIKNPPQMRIAVQAVAAAMTDTTNVAMKTEAVAESGAPDGKELEMKMKLEL